MNNIKAIYLFTLLFSLGQLPLSGQRLDHKLGEFIIQLTDSYDERQAQKQLKEIIKNGEKLIFRRNLVPQLNIYLLSIDYTRVNEIEMLRFLRKQKYIKYAQFNHLIQYRNTPDDPRFDLQWQYINNGGNGGTPGADLDIDLAWDLTTGGLTPNGDTIVICVIDEGFEGEHGDLKGNLWINYEEIPDNNLDDDQNGYIDDYQGWNTYLDNDQLGLVTGHGTPVAGIIGAKGNNGIGVAGVNWNVKIMPVVGGGDEALALAAYAYPYSFRKKYNESGGKEGAFVVATNASWGVARKKAEEAPIWCAFYDSLGEEGIINVAATENSNVDIDEVGDLPTTCSSDYLIGVTNVDRSGEKFGGAAFGPLSIDLGAFGAQVYTLSSSDSYGSFGGTSAAAPHVSGTVGLMYAAPCPALSALALNDPGAAALLVRQYLLEGVVPVVSLENITTTGGRLNINNTLQLLLEACPPCPAPSLIKATEITDQSITLEWVETDSIQEVDIYWRAEGSSEWNIQKNAAKPYQFNNLLSCQYYEFQLRSLCRDTLSDFSKTVVVETDGCCRPPAALTLEALSANGVQINWSPVLAAQSYTVQFRQNGETTWMEENTTDPSIQLVNLLSCTLYEVQVQTVCDTGSTVFGAFTSFSTLGCGSCLDLQYCLAKGVDASGEWIAGVSLGDWNNESGSDGGYGDYTGGIPPQFEVQDTYALQLTPGYDGQNWDEYFRVWIDYNQDGLFDEINELAFDPGEAKNSAVTGEVTIPATAKSGMTRMRVAMEFSGFAGSNKPDPCERSIEFGEVEDYCIEITRINILCQAAAEIRGTLITPGAATISWDELSSDHRYQLEYRESGTESWKLVELDTNSYRLSGLSACSFYQSRVRTSCAPDTLSAYSPIYEFATTCPCFTPMNLNISQISSSSAMLKWSESTNAQDYSIRLRAVGDPNWMEFSSGKDSTLVESLSACTEYEYQLRANCSGNTSSYSALTNFTTSCNTSTDELALGQLSLFPNPVQQQLSVRFQLVEETPILLSLWNTQGQLLYHRDLGRLHPGTQLHRLDLSDLPAGMYLLKLESGKRQAIRRVIRQY